MQLRSMLRLGLQVVSGVGLAACYHPVHAQQAPQPGIEAVTLNQPEYIFDTAEQHKVRVVVVVHGLRHPFAVALLPDGDALVSELGVGLRLIHNAAAGAAQLDPTPIDAVSVPTPLSETMQTQESIVLKSSTRTRPSSRPRKPCFAAFVTSSVMTRPNCSHRSRGNSPLAAKTSQRMP